MADVKWIKVTTDIFDDEKILLIDTILSAYIHGKICMDLHENEDGIVDFENLPIGLLYASFIFLTFLLYRKVVYVIDSFDNLL